MTPNVKKGLAAALASTAVIGGVTVSLVTEDLMKALHRWEGRVYTPYQDIAGVWTVCAGITGPAVIPGKTYTVDQCEALEAYEIQRHGRGVAACVTAPVTQKRYESLALFAYNVGIKGACESTAVRLLNAGDVKGGCEALLMWSKVKGNFVRGLWNRRVFERDWCLK
jgi:lysozyme